jgi:hypothetical protein
MRQGGVMQCQTVQLAQWDQQGCFAFNEPFSALERNCRVVQLGVSEWLYWLKTALGATRRGMLEMEMAFQKST